VVIGHFSVDDGINKMHEANEARRHEVLSESLAALEPLGGSVPLCLPAFFLT
jgi:hypothetical protein